MNSKPPPGRHFDARDALDYLDHLLSPVREREIEEHLATPCAACRERVRVLAALLARMRPDRSPEVPESLHRRALEAFTARAPVAARPRLAESLARLLFDSWAAPLPAAVRRAVGEARRLRYALEGGALEIECEAEGALTLRGRLAIAEPALRRIEVRAAGERFTAWPDADGAFALERLPARELDLAVVGPDHIVRIPRIRP
jgi:anti-sigma factor RsiW